MIELQRIKSPEQIKETAQEVANGIAKMMSEDRDDVVGKGEGGGGGASRGMRRVRSGGVGLGGGGGGGEDNEAEVSVKQDKQGTRLGVTTSLPIGLPSKPRHKYSEMTRSKQSSKMAEMMEPASSLSSSRAPKGSNAASAPAASSLSTTGWRKPQERSPVDPTQSKDFRSGTVASDPHVQGIQPQHGSALASMNGSGSVDLPTSTANKAAPISADLSRTPSILSTSSTISTFPPSTLPSRNPSFAYDGGGEESSPYSYESVEIGDSIENLLALQTGKMNFSYFIPIQRTKPHDTTSSSDEDSVRDYRLGRRKRSSGATTEVAHNTPQSKGVRVCVCVCACVRTCVCM